MNQIQKYFDPKEKKQNEKQFCFGICEYGCDDPFNGEMANGRIEFVGISEYFVDQYLGGGKIRTFCNDLYPIFKKYGFDFKQIKNDSKNLLPEKQKTFILDNFDDIILLYKLLNIRKQIETKIDRYPKDEIYCNIKIHYFSTLKEMFTAKKFFSEFYNDYIATKMLPFKKLLSIIKKIKKVKKLYKKLNASFCE